MKIRTSRKAGFTLVEIMIVVAIIGLLAAIAIPNFVHARQVSQTNACINNLRQIDAAKQQWALEQGKSSTDEPDTAAITDYIGRSGTTTAGSDIRCPLEAKTAGALAGYTVGDVGTLPVCTHYDDTLAAGGVHPASLDPEKQ